MQRLQWFMLFLLVSVCIPAQSIPKYIHTKSGLFIENCQDTNDLTRYTTDNEVYQAGNKFYFTYTYFSQEKKEYYFMAFPEKKEWQIMSKDSISKYSIDKIKMTILPDISEFVKILPDYNQTVIQYEYLDNERTKFKRTERTGLVENKRNIWLHPPRTYSFKILELAPFPYVKSPYKKGHTWKWALTIGDVYADTNYATWKGQIQNKCKYKIVDTNVIIQTDFGDLPCYKIISVAKNPLGKTYLTSYFNLKYGFVRLEYVNINGSTLIIQLQTCEK